MLTGQMTRQLVIGASLLALLGCELPSDTELLQRFESDRASFTDLVTMSNSDSTVIRIAFDFTRISSNWGWPRPDSLLGFSRQRWDQYRDLFRKLNLADGLYRERLSDSTPVVYLTAVSVGLVSRGHSKGYAYSIEPLSPVVPSLDVDQATLRGQRRHGAAYREIGKGWYLEYEW
jgi:hypothetical protein